MVEQLCWVDLFFCSLVLYFLWILSIFFQLSYWLCLLLIVCGDIQSSSGSDRRVWVLYSDIRGLHANLDEFAEA